jgi:hypothetical protein
MPDEARKQRAIEAVTKYRDTLTSPERIAAFAVWFAEQEFGWKGGRSERPADRSDVGAAKRRQAQRRASRLPHRWWRVVSQRSAHAICAAGVGKTTLSVRFQCLFLVPSDQSIST